MSRPDRKRNHHPFYRPALYPRYSSHGFGDPQDYRGLHPFHLSPHHHLPHQSRLPPHHPYSYPHLPLVHLPYLPWTTSPTPASAIFLVPSPPIPAFPLALFLHILIFTPAISTLPPLPKPSPFTSSEEWDTGTASPSGCYAAFQACTIYGNGHADNHDVANWFAELTAPKHA
ncbi:hypothetical protein LQV05_002048 [Cryptococcus neoformans]|nr:hypothetical protein J007_06245 [Cryptococcus neoformans var. grubii]OXC58227.1 hypothetical protein C358_06337 [Cryptococcus neoformans var. grubii MW-RSA852]UOH85229.1 hypothetical protein LQV05_002048 [Cryptococcus neoformans]